jgi:hypothetical protein
MPAVSELGVLIATMRSQSPPVPYRQIAAQLGISVGKVQRELARANVPEAAAGAAPALIAFDPEVSDSRRRLEMGRLDLARQRLDLDRMELEQRMTMIEAAKAGKSGDNASMFVLLLGEINRLRESMARPAGAGAGGLIDELSRLREVGEIVKAMAPAPTMSGREGVEMTVALERIRAENERIFREREAELQTRRLEIEGQAARDHALARMIEGLAPVAAAAAQKYVETRIGPKPATGPLLTEAAPAPAGQAVASGRGHCPRCNYPPGDQEMELVPSGGDDVCPGCSALLAVEGGRIVLAGARQNGTAATPATAAQPSTNGHGPALPSYTS